ncbi:hypothetical cytosolic protein [Syntrophus aciditrophicus SB]|uniref:Hypothetical cytosolic protein n=2 Tax=Syntrophus TaxID=43773 RepID=Q2LTP8_SYNAS|nr:hypothetical cytosolic protein [Syntrophus aciditrophicus SB]
MMLSTKILRLKREDLVLIQYILEGYEGICSISTVDSRVALIRVTLMPGLESALSEILDRLRSEFNFEDVPPSCSEFEGKSS